MKNIPIQILYLLIIIPFTFIVEEIAFLYRFEWDFTEVYLDDPIYLVITSLWLAIVVWVSADIIRRKKHVPNTIKILFIIALLFYGLDITEFDLTFNEMALNAISALLWLSAYFISNNKSSSEWFVK